MIPVMTEVMKALEVAISPQCISEQTPLGPLTTFRVGGPADILILPRRIEELQKVMQILSTYNIEPFILGGGANVLIQDGGIRGVVIGLKDLQEEKSCHQNTITMSAGFSLKEASLYAYEQGLQGLEFAIGIPGSLGGAVFMNAGAYDGEMVQVVSSVTTVDMQGHIHTYGKEALDFSYRHSRFQEHHEIIVRVEFQLEEGHKESILEKMNELTEKREAKQPLEYASAGSTFKRPPGYYAGTLIEETGLKGLSVGHAEVSTKHAGFVINRKNATAQDVLAVIHYVQEKIKEVHGVDLETEVRIVGEPLGNPKQTVIVKATDETIPKLAQICKDTFRETFGHDNTEEQLQQFFKEAYDEEVLRQEINHPHSETYLAYVNGELGGYLKVNWGDAQTEQELAHAFEVQRIYVLKKFQGTGLGKALFEKALHIAYDGPFEWAWLGVWEHNEKAQNFYGKYGFTKFGEHQFLVGEKVDVDWLLKKSLVE